MEKEVTDSIEFENTNFGTLHDIISLRLIYSSADVFVAPSIMDAFGKTLAESMACGTPVVSFDATGPSEIVDHMENGYKAKPYEPKDIADGIRWVTQTNKYNQLCSNAREKVAKTFDSLIIAEQYISLYNEMLKNDSTVDVSDT